MKHLSGRAYSPNVSQQTSNYSRPSKFGQLIHGVKTALLPLLGVGIIGGIGAGLAHIPYIDSSYNGTDTINPHRIPKDTPFLDAWSIYLSGISANQAILSDQLAQTCTNQREDLSLIVSSICLLRGAFTSDTNQNPANLAKQ